MIFAAAAVLWLSGLVSGCGGSAGMPAAGGEISQSGTEMTEGNSATGKSSAEMTEGNSATGKSSAEMLPAGGETSHNYYDMEFHRGGRDARPENTLYAYQYALENGALTIECDMQLTADGQIVLSHNPALNPDITTDAGGKRVEADRYFIHDMLLEEV